MSRAFPWNVLGIDATKDAGLIRKAYAGVLRGLNVDEDIAGYANLRRARDEALWLEAQADQDDEGDYGLGGLDEDDAYDDNSADFGLADGWQDAPDIYSPEAPHDAPAPEFSSEPTPELAKAQTKAQTAWAALLDLLYPGGEVSDDSVTYAEMEDGLAHLAVLLDHADRADLAEHDALDGALADVFARTWPRSAPFVEPANAALHWLDEAGQIEERPALMFLNARLKGMRFHDKVQEPGHPLHKAWAELSRPGRAGFVDRLRVKRLDIDKLLSGLRQHYPELESHLAPERVTSWEGDVNPSGVSNTGPKVVRGIFIVLLVVAVPRLISNLIDSPDNDPAATLLDTAPSAEEIDAEVTSIFGEDVDMNAVRTADPVFADQLRNAFNAAPFSDTTPLVHARRKALEAGEVADFDTLIARAQLRRLWLTAAQRQAPGVCQNVLVGDFFSIPLELTDDELDSEGKLLRQMLDAKVLSHQAKGGAFEYAVPGWMVGEAMTLTGLSSDALTAALRNTADPNRCKVERALLDIIVAKPGRVSLDLLRGL